MGDVRALALCGLHHALRGVGCMARPREQRSFRKHAVPFSYPVLLYVGVACGMGRVWQIWFSCSAFLTLRNKANGVVI